MRYPILQHFEYDNDPPHIKDITIRFHVLAYELCEELPPGPETSVFLRKLLESRDAAVRAAIDND